LAKVGSAWPPRVDAPGHRGVIPWKWVNTRWAQETRMMVLSDCGGGRGAVRPNRLYKSEIRAPMPPHHTIQNRKTTEDNNLEASVLGGLPQHRRSQQMTADHLCLICLNTADKRFRLGLGLGLELGYGLGVRVRI